ncbi:hypothetical protein O9992_02390 [Vibrio lentus]|nr:hypothetical protein [Vibrio lentus]
MVLAMHRISVRCMAPARHAIVVSDLDGIKGWQLRILKIGRSSTHLYTLKR